MCLLAELQQKQVELEEVQAQEKLVLGTSRKTLSDRAKGKKWNKT